MTEFRTTLKPQCSGSFIGLNSQILTIGSCFSDLTGHRLSSFKVKTMANPFGNLYNPWSVHKALGYAINTAPPPPHTFVQHDDLNLNYDFHSRISSPDRIQLEAMLNDTIGKTRDFLKTSTVLLVTYGTAWVYHRHDNREIVSHCHKMPPGLFYKSLLTPEEISDSFDIFYKALKKVNPGIRMILTVSPVRHIKDTLELNSVSKSVLRLSCHTIKEQYQDVEYFPSYELLLDDLRDYRFYKGDMIHPSEEAEDYIWEHFASCYGDEIFKGFIRKWKAIQAALAHRPFHPGSGRHQIFLHETIQKLEELRHLVDVENEIQGLRTQIVSP